MTVLDLRGADIAIRGAVGTDLEVSITFTDSGGSAVDISGYTVAADVIRGTSTVVDSFASAVSGAGSNILTLTLTDTETTTIGNESGLKWRLNMTASGSTEQWLAGEFRLFSAGHPKAGSGSSTATVQVSGSVTATASVPLPLATLDGRYLLESNNLSDLTDAATARTNLGVATAEYSNSAVSGNYYTGALGSHSTVVASEGFLVATPMFNTRAINVDRIAVNVTVAGTTGAVIRLGAFTQNDTSGALELLFDAGTVTAESTGVREITIDQELPAGLVYLAMACQGGAGTRPTLTNASGRNPLIGSRSVDFATVASGRVNTGVTGAFSASYAAASLASAVPIVWVRFASYA